MPRKKGEPPFANCFVVAFMFPGSMPNQWKFAISYGPGEPGQNKYVNAFQSEAQAKIICRMGAATYPQYQVMEMTWERIKGIAKSQGILYLRRRGDAQFHRFDGQRLCPGKDVSNID